MASELLPCPRRPSGAGPRTEAVSRYDETTLYSDFRYRLGARSGMPAEPVALPWLAIMRHYDLPNRVLDWSTSMQVALHFALIDEPLATPHLWVLNARALNEVTGNAGYVSTPLRSADAPVKPWIWLPDSFDAAIRA